MKRIFLYILITISQKTTAQDSASLSSFQSELGIACIGNSLVLEQDKYPALHYMVKGCQKLKYRDIRNITFISVKMSDSVIYTFAYAPQYDAEGSFTDSCYVGICHKINGEIIFDQVDMRKRDKNVYEEKTETVSERNNFGFIISLKTTVTKIAFPRFKTIPKEMHNSFFYIDNYVFEDCIKS